MYSEGGLAIYKHEQGSLSTCQYQYKYFLRTFIFAYLEELSFSLILTLFEFKLCSSDSSVICSISLLIVLAFRIVFFFLIQNGTIDFSIEKNKSVWELSHRQKLICYCPFLCCSDIFFFMKCSHRSHSYFVAKLVSLSLVIKGFKRISVSLSPALITAVSFKFCFPHTSWLLIE